MLFSAFMVQTGRKAWKRGSEFSVSERHSSSEESFSCYFDLFFIFILLVVIGVEARMLFGLHEHSTTELQPKPFLRPLRNRGEKVNEEEERDGVSDTLFLSCLEDNHHFGMTVFGRKDFLPPFPVLPCTHLLPLGVTRELLWSMNFIFHLSISSPRLYPHLKGPSPPNSPPKSWVPCQSHTELSNYNRLIH